MADDDQSQPMLDRDFWVVSALGILVSPEGVIAGVMQRGRRVP